MGTIRNRTLIALLLLGLGGSASTAAVAPQDPAPKHPLAPRHAAWMKEVGVLLWTAERDAFLALADDYRRDAFIARFWQLRDPDEDTSVNEFREEYEARVDRTLRELGNLKGDRALAMLVAGFPQRRVSVRCAGLLPRLEVWTYSGREATGGEDWALVFRHRSGSEEGWQLWKGALGLSGLAATPAPMRESELAARVATTCHGGALLVETLGDLLDRQRLLQLRPRPNPAWLRRFAERTTDLPARALTFPATLTWQFPGQIGQRMKARGTLRIPVESVTESSSANSGYAFLLDGEIVHQEHLFESFRYRFSLPLSAGQPGAIALRFERRLRPGNYRVILRLEDLPSGHFARVEQGLEVPSSPSNVLGPDLAGSTEATTGGETTAQQDVELRLVPPAPRLHTGKLRLITEVTGEPASVEFRLDEQPSMRKNRPPWSVEVDLGSAPAVHRIVARARDAAGKVIARDELLINTGPHRLAVRLTEPLPGSRHTETLRARAEVEVPIGERLDRLEFYLGEQRVATLYQPPFEVSMQLPDGPRLTYVRAVAWLQVGMSHEDVVFVNTPEHLGQIEVHTVELYTSVTDRQGEAVLGLSKTNFRVFEDDAPQVIRRFERVRDLPFWGAVLLDTSESMTQELEEAVHAVVGFFDAVVTARDRAAIFTVAEEVELVAGFNSKRRAWRRNLDEVVAQGNTRLYDGLLRALYEFGGLSGKRALVVITDGLDSASEHSLEEVLIYARHSGVAVYSIGLGVDSRSIVARSGLLRLAEATGGRTFLIRDASRLERVYREIEDEIRSQYLLVYQSSGSGEEFRQVRVEVKDAGLEAHTIPGYTP